MLTESIVEILLAEDNPEDAEMTIRALKKVNLANHLTHVEDGQEALDFIYATGNYRDRSQSPHPRLIILDVKMPRIDGIEVLKRLKTNEDTRSIPIVILTSSAEERDMIESYHYGVNSYVVKPVEFAQFMKAVSDLGLYWLLINRSMT
ncbi:MAG: response regulator [Chitinophagaceae bacterium]